MCNIYICKYSLLLVLFFFFSSRRRHTRWPRDWSSDVCSSDLDFGTRRRLLDAHAIAEEYYREQLSSPGAERSEERRVGKECRSGWATSDQKHKKSKLKQKQTPRIVWR